MRWGGGREFKDRLGLGRREIRLEKGRTKGKWKGGKIVFVEGGIRRKYEVKMKIRKDGWKWRKKQIETEGRRKEGRKEEEKD